MSDIEIANSVKMNKIKDIANDIGVSCDDVILYGDYKAKICKNGSKRGKLILVTATSPTPMGEGKTTVSIGLCDALKKLGKNSILSLREPSMGPVFGMKGGACGGGFSQVVPMEDINLHFTGDFHAISSANNLINAAIYNHIENGNKLGIDKVLFERAIDVNDRSLRHIVTKYGNDSFNITAASEVMSVFCLASDLDELRDRLSKIVIGIDTNSNFIYLRDLNIVGSLVVLLKDAFLPNLVQTLEKSPAFIHGGPFANIAHGCSSLVSLKMALSYGDYVVTEAGFGADLGAEKFYDILCRDKSIKPDLTVLVTTIKSLKYHGGMNKDDILKEDLNYLEKGFNNLLIHYQNLKRFNKNIIVCLNKFSTDTDREIKLLEDFCLSNDMEFAVSNSYSDGFKGALLLANKVLENINYNNQFKTLYDVNLSIEEKIEIIAKKIYRADSVNYSDAAKNKIDIINKNGLSNLPICVSKTQYSLSDDCKNVVCDDKYSANVSDIKLYNGASFITVLFGSVVTMPGLPKCPNYEKIDFVDGKIIGLS